MGKLLLFLLILIAYDDLDLLVNRRDVDRLNLVLAEHGFPHARKVEVDGRWLIEVSRNPMGEL